MKFILDAHIPPSLCDIFKRNGYKAMHTMNLPHKNESSDKEICKAAKKQGLIVITKDSDFYYSHLLLNEPEKLLLLKTGNISTQKLKSVFLKYLPEITKAFKTHNLIELHKDCLIY
ncbi:MAG: hypothetical protein COS14_03285 [Bacteroidetes bacterium CG02_land_8_20_14_3_00_31_25]|nr:MAG: hypothetical protein COS14_03285 [Bacteroidetes bacterium CG02_land_8_20_14_3_00_31_25]PIX35903.1 MAG: hypothetical protein COZ59_03945 [Bacteroidetes bacterium CG_4_8_14_3_um_filter_31_14]